MAAKLNVVPGATAVVTDPAALADWLVVGSVPDTEYGVVVAAARPDTGTWWCWTDPAPSGRVWPPMLRTPVVRMLVHHEMTAAVAVTSETTGPRAISTTPVAVVVPDFGVVSAEWTPFELTASTV